MTHQVFVNRMLNLKKIKYIGLDMDHTLIRYKSENFEALVYQFVIDKLIQDKKYPETIAQFKFDFKDAIRGLVVDSRHGNILKLSRYGAIRQSHHGTRPIDFAEQQQFYRSVYVDLGDPNYIAIDTSFSIAFCSLYAQLVDYRDKHPAQLPSYSVMAQDVLNSVDRVHAEGTLKQIISDRLDNFVVRDPNLIAGIKRFIRYGKKIFILTNSDYHYTRQLLDYAITPFLEPGETWLDLFEFVITLAYKPRFFYDKLPFLAIDPKTGLMRNTITPIEPGIYQGGNATQFTDNLNLKGDDILYIGDHIYGDILRLKKDCNWRTALVIEELGEEIEGQRKGFPIEEKILAAMTIKKKLEQEYIDVHTKIIDEKTDRYNKQLNELQTQLNDLDTKITALIKEQQQFYNPQWERIFRAGAEESYFAYQVERFACIYMEKLSDLFELSPLTYFRAPRRTLSHDLME